MLRYFFYTFLALMLVSCSSTQSGRQVMGLPWSPMWIMQTTEDEKIRYFGNFSEIDLCIRWDSAQDRERQYIALALKSRGKDPFICRGNSSVDTRTRNQINQIKNDLEEEKRKLRRERLWSK
jgi:hypothetical protein